MLRFGIWFQCGDHVGIGTTLAQAQIEKQNEINKQQQRAVDELKQIVCALKFDPAFCKEIKK